MTRAAGEALQPARQPLDELARIERALGRYNFAGQYQQAPAPREGGMVKREWFRVYDAPPAPFERIVQSWDTANKASELADYSVCTTWGVKEKQFLSAQRLPQEIELSRAQARRARAGDAFGAHVVLIEDRASGTQLIQELIGEDMHRR